MVWVGGSRVKDVRLRFGSGWDGTSAKARALQAVPLFAHCSRSELRTLVELTTEVDARAGALLCRGDGPPQFLIVTKGRVEVTANGGRPETVGPGSCVPASGTRLKVGETPTVRAESDAQIIVMSAAEFASMIDLVPSVRAYLSGMPQGHFRPSPAPSARPVAETPSARAAAGAVSGPAPLSTFVRGHRLNGVSATLP